MIRRLRAVVCFLPALLAIGLAAFGLLEPLPTFGQQGSGISLAIGQRLASAYNVANQVAGGPFAAGTVSITLARGGFVTADGRSIYPYTTTTPLLIGFGSNQDTVTPTAVSGCNSTAQSSPPTCTITVATTYTHGSGDPVYSGSYGLQEAINDAAGFVSGSSVVNAQGGVVVIDKSWGGSNATITAATPFSTVSLLDIRSGQPRYWNMTPTGAALATITAPTTAAACTATIQLCSDATVAGSASWATAIYASETCVDMAGNESPGSLTTVTFVPVASMAIDMPPPAAETGCVGWVPYLSLANGTYAQAYQIPVTSSVCTMTTLETITPACAIANTTYGQATSTFGASGLFKGGAQITGYPVNTGQHFPALASTVQTTASYTPVSNSSQTYSYAPGNRVGLCGSSSANVVNYAAGASSTTGIPMAVATWTIPANCVNYIGAEFRVSGKFTWTDGGASDAMKVLVKWDAAGTNTTTVPTTLCSIANTHTNAAAAQNATYSCTVKIATTGATGTALVNGTGEFDIATGPAGVLIGPGLDIATAASAAINLTVPARIAVYFTDTGATANPGAQGLEATLEALN